MDRKIRVGAVSYLNTIPLLYGIQHSDLLQDIELIIDYPSRIASLLLNNSIDIGLVPVAIIPEMREYYINTNYCIGSDGPVASVCLFSSVPIQEVKSLLLDYQSRTSVELVKILLKEYWKIDPELKDTNEEFRHQIKGSTAGLIIGDRALEQRKISPYVYDLGEAWKNLTGLPFVYAAWISNKVLPEQFLRKFDEANREGLEQIEVIVAENRYEGFNLRDYFTKYLNYRFDEDKKMSMEKFLSYLKP